MPSTLVPLLWLHEQQSLPSLMVGPWCSHAGIDTQDKYSRSTDEMASAKAKSERSEVVKEINDRSDRCNRNRD